MRSQYPKLWSLATATASTAGENPEMLRELQRQFLIEAVKYNVLPLDDRRIERFNSDWQADRC